MLCGIWQRKLWTKRRLAQGERIVEVLKQGEQQPIPVQNQVMIIHAVTNDLLADIPVDNIAELVQVLNKEKDISKFKTKEIIFNENYDIDFSEVKGQENVKRALEIAAAGGHNCLLIGSPGSRKNNACKKDAHNSAKFNIRRSFRNYEDT